jgi:hypothetical protein
MTPTHCVTLRTTIFKSIANTFDMNAMVGCGLRQLKMPRPADYLGGGRRQVEHERAVASPPMEHVHTWRLSCLGIRVFECFNQHDGGILVPIGARESDAVPSHLTSLPHAGRVLTSK